MGGMDRFLYPLSFNFTPYDSVIYSYTSNCIASFFLPFGLLASQRDGVGP